MSIHVTRAPTVPLTSYDTKRSSHLKCLICVSGIFISVKAMNQPDHVTYSYLISIFHLCNQIFSRRSSTKMIRVRRSPIRKIPVLASLLSTTSFYGACSESAKEGSKTVNQGLLLTSFWRPDMLFPITLGLCD